MSDAPVCLVCEEVITNPVCFSCLQREVEEWLSLRNPKIIPKVKKAANIFHSYSHLGIRCILCGKNMNVCTHCYCDEIHRLIKDEALANEFLTIFNFELKQ